MRKALLHIFLLCALFLNSGAGFAAAMPHAAMTAQAVQKVEATVINDAFSESNSLFHKNDVINDIDDSDEYDCDEHHEVLKQKLIVTAPIPSLKSNLTSVDFGCKSFYGAVYTLHNFSRLPRFDYISLRVLRI